MTKDSIEKLHKFAITLNSSLQIDHIIQKATIMLRNLVGGLGCHILLMREIKEELEINTVIHSGHKTFPPHVKEDVGVSKLTLERGIPLLINDTLDDPRVTPAFVEWFGHRSMISAPIFVKNDIIGVIVIYSDKVGYYSSDDASMLMMYGSHLGLAIENARLIRKLQQAAIMDGLTEAYNHTFFRNLFKDKLKDFKGKEGKELSLLMLDINDFKHINDTHGHLAGDYVLREISSLIKANLRPGDILARYGGDEFAILLPNCNQEKALGVQQRILDSLKEHIFKFNNFAEKIQISTGIASYQLDGFTDTELIDTADKRMYTQKFQKSS